ncbi:PTS sugar transporter subunit IIA [Caviibacter abscessus]|uniref:PTS sugar transporter subunit IIA n=1 Tax=Caviibacter abscessus TaxID=1766719 RepID=UPI00083879FC|nr:PTS glucose transporter subunit IIA [Caviibacter abscessus]
MGFFANLFSKKKEEVVTKNVVVSPIAGKVIPISEVPDETFASKMLGDGVGIEPFASGVMVAPADGVISQLFETGHAFTIETKQRVNILVHFGLNTVELKGKGFEIIAKEGDTVKAGDPIIKYDLEFLKANSPSVITPVVILDSDEYTAIKTFENQEVKEADQTIIEVEL